MPQCKNNLKKIEKWILTKTQSNFLLTLYKWKIFSCKGVEVMCFGCIIFGILLNNKTVIGVERSWFEAFSCFHVINPFWPILSYKCDH
jgi:hypothetical protein